jgi:hypothetical protein
MIDPMNDIQKRIDVATAEQSALRKLDEPRGTFEAEYRILVRDALPATGGSLVPQAAVRRVFDEMMRLNRWGEVTAQDVAPSRRTEFWVTYAYVVTEAAIGARL